MTSYNTNPQRKRLLVLTSTFPRWEGDNEPPFVFELCRRLSADFDVCVLAPHTPGAKAHETLSGLTVVRFRYFFEWGETLAYRGGILANLRSNRFNYLLIPLFFGCQLAALLRLLARENFDIVHAHWLIPQGVIAVAAKLVLRSTPALLCTAHGSDLYGLRGRLFSALKHMVMRRADAVTVVSQAMKNHAVSLKIEPEKISVISMGVDMANIFTPAGHTVRHGNELLFVGRLVASKAVDTLIDAMPTILAGCPNATLTIVGDGPEKVKLEALAKTQGIAGRVSFLGAVANPALPPLYRRATIFISPSQEEGFGLTLVEALACGCAVIASDLPAHRDIVVDGETGLTVLPGDSIAIARAALTLLSDAPLRQLLGSAGREYVLRQFDWASVVTRYARLLDELAAISCHPSCEHQ